MHIFIIVYVLNLTIHGDKLEITEQNKQKLWERQKGMCGLCGKKFDENKDNLDLNYYISNSNEDSMVNSINHITLVCTFCNQYLQNHQKNDDNLHIKKYYFPYSNFGDYSIEDSIRDLTEDIKLFEKAVKSSNEWRNAFNTVKEFNKIIYGLNLSREHHSEVYNLINSIQDILYKRQQEEHQKLESILIDNYNSLKQKIDYAIHNSELTNDFKEAREHLLVFQNEFKEVTLSKEHREELVSLLNKAFEDLNTRFARQKESYEMECSENYLILKKKIDDAIEIVKNSNDIRKARLVLINVQNEFKGLKLKKEQREEQYSRIQNAFEELNKQQQLEQQEYEKECAENYAKLTELVASSIEFSEITIIFKEAREKLIEAQNAIKNSKLKKDHREELFQKIRTAFDTLSERQNIERDSYDKECNDNYNMLKANIEGAIIFAQNSTNFKQARETLISAQNAIKGMRLKKEQREELYSNIRETFNELNRRQSEEREIFEKETSENFDKLNKRAEQISMEIEISNDFRQIRENLIAIQNELRIVKLKKEQRDELFNKIRSAFENFDKKRNEYKENIKKEKVEKLSNLLVNLEDKLVRIEDSISWDVKSLEFQKEKLAQINLMPESESQKAEVLKIIQSIEERIKDKQTSINEVKARILSIQAELNNL